MFPTISAYFMRVWPEVGNICLKEKLMHHFPLPAARQSGKFFEGGASSLSLVFFAAVILTFISQMSLWRIVWKKGAATE